MTSAQAVSAALTKAGHTRSVSHGTRIRGVSSSSAGFRARKYDERGTVSVEHVSGRWSDTREEDAAKVAAYADALRAAGFTVSTNRSTSVFVDLLVTREAS